MRPETEHTPTPWRYVAYGARGEDGPTGLRILPAQNAAGYVGLINGYDEQSVADAAFIVRACNTHDSLVGAAREALAALEPDNDVVLLGGSLRRRRDARDGLRAALAFAEAQP